MQAISLEFDHNSKLYSFPTKEQANICKFINIYLSFCMHSNSYYLHTHTHRHTHTCTHIYLLSLNANQPRIAQLHSHTRPTPTSQLAYLSRLLTHRLQCHTHTSNARAFGFGFAVALANCILAYSACCCCAFYVAVVAFADWILALLIAASAATDKMAATIAQDCCCGWLTLVGAICAVRAARQSYNCFCSFTLLRFANSLIQSMSVLVAKLNLSFFIFFSCLFLFIKELKFVAHLLMHAHIYRHTAYNKY